MQHVQFGEDSVDVPLDEEVRDAIVSEDAKRLESLVGPNAERRATEPMPRDKWFASADSVVGNDEYCYLCTLDPDNDEEFMHNEHREQMKKWVSAADSYEIKGVCKVIQDIYNEHIYPLTKRPYRLEMIREHIHHHDRIQPLLLLRQNIRLTQRLMDYWAGKLVFKSSPDQDDAADPELNEAAERNIRLYQKQMTDFLKLFALLEARKK